MCEHTLDPLESVNTLLPFPRLCLKYQINNYICISKASIFWDQTPNQQMTIWEKIYKMVSRADIKDCVRLHCLSWDATSCRIERSLMTLSCKVRGHISWLDKERENQRGGREGKTKREKQERHLIRTENNSIREWDLTKEVVHPFWFRGRYGEMSCRYLSKISCTDTLLGPHGDVWVC